MAQPTPYALLINDIHVGKDNIAEFHKNWDEAIKVCKEHKIIRIFIGGDLWESRSSQTLPTLIAVKDALIKAQQNNIHVTICDGNHDLINQEDTVSYNSLYSEFDGVQIVNDHATYEVSENVTLSLMAYFPENGSFTKRFQEFQSSLEMTPNIKRILYIHEGIRGGLATSSEDELPASLFKDFDKTLVGHYHNRQKIKGTNIEYIGSSRQHNFGEDEEKGYTLLYRDGTTEFVKNEVNKRFKVIDIDIEDMDDEFMEMLANIKSDERYKVKVRVRCNSKQTPSVDKQKLADCGANKIELITEQTEVLANKQEAITHKFDKSGIKEEYTNFCTQKSIDNQLGLHYLNKL